MCIIIIIIIVIIIIIIIIIIITIIIIIIIVVVVVVNIMILLLSLLLFLVDIVDNSSHIDVLAHIFVCCYVYSNTLAVSQNPVSSTHLVKINLDISYHGCPRL